MLDTHRQTNSRQTNSRQTQHRNGGKRAAASPKTSTQRRGAPCLVRTVNYAINNTELRKPLIHTSVSEGCGGRLDGNCGSMFDDHETKRICSMCVAVAGKRKATPAESAGAGPSKRPKKTKGGSEKGSGSRARSDNSAKLETLQLMDGSFVTT